MTITKEELLMGKKIFLRKKFYTISEISKHFHIHRNTVSKMVREGKLKTKEFSTYRGNMRKRIKLTLKDYDFLHDFAICKATRRFSKRIAKVMRKKMTVGVGCLKSKDSKLSRKDFYNMYACDIPVSFEGGRESQLSDLSNAQIRILNGILFAQESDSQREIAEVIGISASTFSYHLKACPYLNEIYIATRDWRSESEYGYDECGGRVPISNPDIDF